MKTFSTMRASLTALFLAILVIAPTANAQKPVTKKPLPKPRVTVPSKPASPASDLPLFCLKGKVKSVTEKCYYEVDDEGTTKMEFSGETTFHFSPDGFLTGYSSANSEGSRETTQTLDNKGRLRTSSYEGMDEEGDPRTEVLTVKRSAAGRVTVFHITDKSAPSYVIWDYTLTLRPDGKIAKIRHDTEYETWTEVYKYDANGFVSSIQTLSQLGNHALKHTYSAEKDAHGNWLKCKKDDNSVVVREIEYYE